MSTGNERRCAADTKRRGSTQRAEAAGVTSGTLGRECTSVVGRGSTNVCGSRSGQSIARLDKIDRQVSYNAESRRREIGGKHLERAPIITDLRNLTGGS